MKKSFVVFVVLVIIFSGLVFAQSNLNENTSDKVRRDLRNITGSIKNDTFGAFEKEIVIPAALQLPAKVIFGIKTEHKITLERLIVLLAVWFVFFLLVQSLFKIMPFMNEGWQTWVMAFVVTSIIAITGVINSTVIFFFNLGESFKWLESLGPFSIFVALVIAGLIWFGGKKLINYLEEKIELEKVKRQGKAIAMLGAKARAEEKASSELEKK